MELHVPGPAGSVSPGASLVPGGEEGLRHSLRVPVKTLDAYRAARTDRRVGFIKCDCEGHELEVFRGAVELLRRDRPALLFECEQRHLPGASPATVFDFLRALGYRGWFFHASGLLPVAEFRVEVHQPVRPGRYWDAKDYYNNFAFVPADEGSQERDK